MIYFQYTVFYRTELFQSIGQIISEMIGAFCVFGNEEGCGYGGADAGVYGSGESASGAVSAGDGVLWGFRFGGDAGI